MPISAMVARRAAAWNSFDPRSLGSLELWLDSLWPAGMGQAKPADHTQLSQWNDLSGKGRHLTQATGANQPYYRSQSPNLLSSVAATFEGSTIGFATYGTASNWTIVAGQSPTYGVNSLRIAPDAAATGYRGVYAISSSVNSQRIPVVAGKTYYLGVDVYTVAAPGTCMMLLEWRDSNLALISSKSVTAAMAAVGSKFTLSGSGVAPANAAYVYICYALTGYTAGSTIAEFDGGYLYADTLQPSWSPPVLLPAGHPVVNFDGVKHSLASSSFSTSSLALSMYVVAYTASARGAGYEGLAVMGTSGSSMAELQRSNTNPTLGSRTDTASSGTGFNQSVNYATNSLPIGGPASVYSWVLDPTGPTVLTSWNGTTTSASIAIGAATKFTGPFKLAVDDAGTRFLQGGISAALVFSATHTTAQRKQVERWLGRIYSISVG